MSDEDEDVVFQNSALYDHLKGVGYTDNDVNPEEFQSSSDNTHSQWQFFDEGRSAYEEKLTFWTKLKNSVDKAFWDEDWTDQLTQVHNKYADELTDGILESPVLEEDDGTYIESFFLSMQSYRPEASRGETSIMGTMLMQLAILGASLAYAGFRMVYLKSPDVTSRVYVWSIDIIAVVLTIAALTPTTVKSASAGRIVGKLKTFSVTCKQFLKQIQDFHKLLGKSVRLLHELELVARGFTVISPLTPVTKVDESLMSQRQCPRLRKLTFLVAREVMLSAKFSAKSLLSSFPSHVEIEGLSSYLANQPLYMYGPCVMTTGDKDDEKLRAVTDNYSLAAVKAMVKLCNVHVSEFLRVLAMSVLTGAEEHDKNPSFGQQEVIIRKLRDKMESHMKPVSKLYTLQKCLHSSSKKAVVKTRDPLNQTPTESLYVAIHSLSLHLQAAQHRIHKVEEELEKVLDQEEEGQDQSKSSLTPELLSQVTSDLKVIHIDLNACQDCVQESEIRIKKYTGKNHAPSGEQNTTTIPTSSGNDQQQEKPTPFEIGDPIIQDQVFEAYVGSEDQDTTPNNEESFLSEEEKVKSREEREAAVRLLRELKSVITVRAVETEKREREALMRQYPNVNFCDPMISLRSQKEPQTDNNEVVSSPRLQPASDTMDGASRELPECIKESGGDMPMASDCCPFEGGASDKLRKKLASLGGSDFAFSSNVAAMAAARSHEIAAMSEDTFGDDDVSDDDRPDISNDHVPGITDADSVTKNNQITY